MSPMSVAQYIGLDQDKFDLVIFDEASQMPTSEAVGAVARGKSLIVVGDPKQMPPTSFFSSTNVDVEEACIDDMESILEDCRTLEIPSLQLSWHYRSRHESLIAFSNNEYYNGSLITFPSVDDRCTKVHYVPVSGYYDKGGKRYNMTEAKVIVKEIVRRLRDEELRKKSIGVIAFSVVQQSLIEDLLQEQLEKDKTLQDAVQQMYEPVFVKNLENVQGDERDVILFSIGYGPDKDGKISMNFGPLNNSGGERRLNVAVSRARQEMYVFSTLKSSDIDLRRSKARGVEGLKHFLLYAETQYLPSSSQHYDKHSNDTLLAEQIAAELKKRGYAVATNVGRSQFKVDVAICDEKKVDTYCLGILLDGEGYRNTHTTRDREVVQPSVLSSLNWKVMRVWSVDWFNNKDRVINRIIERLSSESETEPKSQVKSFDVSQEKLEECSVNAQEYIYYNASKAEAINLADETLMQNIISIEQPITFMLLCRRVCALRGGRVTPTLQKKLSLYESSFYKDDSGVLWLNESDSRDYQIYRFNSHRDIIDIPQIELLNAIRESLSEQVAIDEDSLTLIAAKKLGFMRRGINVDTAFKKAIEVLKNMGEIESVGGNIRLK